MSEPVDRDILMTRVIDGRASQDDWRRLRLLAEVEPEIWMELEQTQSMQGCLDAAMEVEIEACSRVDLADPDHRVFHERMSAVRSWGGWLIAAAVLLAWSLNIPMQQGTGALSSKSSIGPNPGSNYIQVDEPVDALRAYVDRGRQAGTVVGLMPDVQVLRTNPASDGSGYEVYLLRQILEKQRVTRVFRWTQDEAGNLHPVVVETVQHNRKPF